MAANKTDRALVNPVKLLRKKLAMSQQALADDLGITRIALLRYEQGCPPSLASNDQLLYLIEAELGLTPVEAQESYHQFQQFTRRSNYGILDPDMDWGSSKGGAAVGGLLVTEFGAFPKHPLLEWINASADCKTLTALSVGLCLHIPVMYDFVNGGKTIPDMFLVALLDSGYDAEVLRRFDRAVVSFALLLAS